MAAIQDFLPWLHEAIERLRTSGWPAEADELDAAARSAYTTSSEMLGEVGRTILKVERGLGPVLPYEISELLQRCLVEIRRVWPGLR